VNRYEHEDELYEQEKRELEGWERGDMEHDLEQEEAMEYAGVYASH
jgi:hypothetical protein